MIAALGVRGHPTLALLGRNGEVTRTWFGAAEVDDLRPLVEALIAQ